MNAYHRYIQLGCIVQELVLHLAINHRQAVWKSFNGWLRTMKPDLVPSEMVVAQALRNALPEYLLNSPQETELTKFITDHAESERLPGITMAA